MDNFCHRNICDDGMFWNKIKIQEGFEKGHIHIITIS